MSAVSACFSYRLLSSDIPGQHLGIKQDDRKETPKSSSCVCSSVTPRPPFVLRVNRTWVVWATHTVRSKQCSLVVSCSAVTTTRMRKAHDRQHKAAYARFQRMSVPFQHSFILPLLSLNHQSFLPGFHAPDRKRREAVAGNSRAAISHQGPSCLAYICLRSFPQ